MPATSIDYAAIARQHGGLPLADYDVLAKKFGGIALNSSTPPSTGTAAPQPASVADGLETPSATHPVHHASDDIGELRASAERQSSKVGDVVAAATENVPGAKVEAVRDAKDAQRIEDKTERQGVAPSQIADISGAKVSVPDQAAAGQVLANLDKTLPVQKAEGSVTGEPAHNDIRQVQAIVDTKAPAGEPVKKSEIILQTPEMHAASEDTHGDYRKSQDLRAAGKTAEADALDAKIARDHEAAEQAARTRLEVQGALPQPSTGSVLQSSQKETGEAGSERGRVERSQQGKEVATQSAEAGIQKERPTGSAPIPPARLKELQAKLSTSAAPVENLRDQKVEVQDPTTGQWKPGKVLADNSTGDGERQLRRLRGVYDDGSKFNDVKTWQVRRATQAPAASASSAKRPDIGVDFDGTLFTDTGTGEIGKPLPERIASVKKMLADGKTVEIITRRVEGRPGQVTAIQDALEAAGLPRLSVTDRKSADMLYDDNAHHAPTNANTPLTKSNNAKKQVNI